MVNYLDAILVEKIQFQTYIELQITSKHLDLPKMINQEKFRIDLAAINKIDASIHFFEAETQLHIQHPLIFKNFCDYCYIVCPDVQFDLLDSITTRQQLNWAKKAGIGIISISDDGALRIRLSALQQQLKPVVRKEVIRIMNTRYRIRFTTIPLWERSRKTQPVLES
ncbi:MAG: hypothetical protein ACFFAJ_06610 [Candidatus Hodarchaeota archaeon]